MFCQSLGFDSELAAKICKDYGCSIEMLKDIAKWHLQQKQARALEHQNELKALQDKHSELSNLAEKQAIELAQVKEALAEFGKGIQAIKAEQKQAIKALEKEHKKAINSLVKEHKKRVNAEYVNVFFKILFLDMVPLASASIKRILIGICRFELFRLVMACDT